MSSTSNAQSANMSSHGTKRPKTDWLETVKDLIFDFQKVSSLTENEKENIAKLSYFQHECDCSHKRMLVNSELIRFWANKKRSY